MIKFLIVFFIFLNSVIAQPNLEQLLYSIKTFKGEFTQIVTDQNGEIIQEVEGRVLFKKPNFFRWNYVSTFQNEVVSDGELLYLYDPDLKQVVVSPLSKLGGVSPAMLLVATNITILFITNQVQDKNGINWFRSIPRDKDQAFFKEVYINFDDSKLNIMRIIDNFDNVTDINFKNIIQNNDINDATFLFNFPEGVDVIKN